MKKTVIQQRKSLGQVFLKEDWPCAKMVELLKSEGITHVLEIGPGPGILTKFLLKAGLHVTAVEKDTRFSDLLQFKRAEMLAGTTGTIEIINADILKFDLVEWSSSTKGTLAICGNIPYNISTPILRMALPLLSRIKFVAFLVQLEFAARVAASANTEDYGSLSVFTQLRAVPKLEFMVKKTCFSPVPKVDSAVLTLKPHLNMEPEEVLEKTEMVTRQAFTQRRKMMSNSISIFLKPGVDTSNFGFPLTVRCETLTPAMWVHLAKTLFSLK